MVKRLVEWPVAMTHTDHTRGQDAQRRSCPQPTGPNRQWWQGAGPASGQRQAGQGRCWRKKHKVSVIDCEKSLLSLYACPQVIPAHTDPGVGHEICFGQWYKRLDAKTWKEKCIFELPFLLLLFGCLQPVSDEQTQASLLDDGRRGLPPWPPPRQLLDVWGRPSSTSCPVSWLMSGPDLCYI